MSRQLVTSLRQRHGELPRRAPVELGRPARARSLAPGAPRELDLEQAIVDELVQVELGLVPRYPDPRGRLVAANRRALIEHVEVEGAPGRLGQAGEPRQIRADPVPVHARLLPGRLPRSDHTGAPSIRDIY